MLVDHLKLIMGEYDQGGVIQVVCSPEAGIYTFALPGGKYEVRLCAELLPEEQSAIAHALDITNKPSEA